MFKNNKKIAEIREEIEKIWRLIEHQNVKIEGVVQQLASLRGLINRKIYSGKLNDDAPDWLSENMELLGINKKDKKAGNI